MLLLTFSPSYYDRLLTTITYNIMATTANATAAIATRYCYSATAAAAANCYVYSLPLLLVTAGLRSNLLHKFGYCFLNGIFGWDNT